MREVERGQFDLFHLEVLPHVQLGPITDGEDAEIFVGFFTAVIQIPQFRPLVFGVPLTKLVAVREEPLLGAGFFLIAPRPADGRVYLELSQRVQQGDCLQPVAAGVRAGFFHCPPLVNAVLHVADDQSRPQLFHERIAEGQCFREVVAGVHME